MFHKITSLQIKSDYLLVVGFSNNKVKLFDLRPYIEKYKPFKQLVDQPGLYETAKIDIGGYGIVWNDELDISAEGIYEKGLDYCVTDKASLTKRDLLADYIRIRHDLHVSQKQLENMTHIPQSCIARLETTDIDPKMSTIIKLLAAMGYTLKIEPQN